MFWYLHVSVEAHTCHVILLLIFRRIIVHYRLHLGISGILADHLCEVSLLPDDALLHTS